MRQMYFNVFVKWWYISIGIKCVNLIVNVNFGLLQCVSNHCGFLLVLRYDLGDSTTQHVSSLGKNLKAPVWSSLCTNINKPGTYVQVGHRELF